MSGQFNLLSRQPEPRRLIPELGRAIREAFPEDAIVLVNFMTWQATDYGPHLPYYAQRDILNYAITWSAWEDVMRTDRARAAGVIWPPGESGAEILAKLPGEKRKVVIDGVELIFWKAPPA
jgi:hypothetical protein